AARRPDGHPGQIGAALPEDRAKGQAEQAPAAGRGEAMSLEQLGKIGEAAGGRAATGGRSAAAPKPREGWGFGILNGKLLGGMLRNLQNGDTVLSPSSLAKTIEAARDQGLHQTSMKGFALAAKQQQTLIGNQLANFFRVGDKPPQSALEYV